MNLAPCGKRFQVPSLENRDHAESRHSQTEADIKWSSHTIYKGPSDLIPASGPV